MTKPNGGGSFFGRAPSLADSWRRRILATTGTIIGFDHYTKPQYYGVVKSRDLEHWQDVSDRVLFPSAARHGTVLKVPEEVLRRIEASTRKR